MSKAYPVEGLKQLDAYLSALPKNMQTGAYRAGLTAAARVIREEARLRAPRKTGKLAKAIRSGSPRRNQDGSFSISVSLRGQHAFLGRFFEYGVAPHYITAGDSDLSARKLTQAVRREGSSDVSSGALKIGANYVTGAVLHPGIRPHPFLRPALDVKADEAVQAFAERIRAYIEGKTGFTSPVAEAA